MVSKGRTGIEGKGSTGVLSKYHGFCGNTEKEKVAGRHNKMNDSALSSVLVGWLVQRTQIRYRWPVGGASVHLFVLRQESNDRQQKLLQQSRRIESCPVETSNKWWNGRWGKACRIGAPSGRIKTIGMEVSRWALIPVLRAYPWPVQGL